RSARAGPGQAGGHHYRVRYFSPGGGRLAGSGPRGRSRGAQVLTRQRRLAERQAQMVKTIVVPLDGSTLAERALGMADQLARRLEARVILMRAPNMAAAYSLAASTYGFLVPDMAVERVHAEARDYLAGVQHQEARRGVAVETVLVDADPAAAIVDTAARTQ